MEFFERLLMNLTVFQIVTEIIQATIGVGLCFGALKWRKGLLTTTAIGWGFVLGIVFAFIFGDILGETGALTCVAIGVLVMPLLTYTVFSVNRFVLGFLVGCKLLIMLTTVLAKEGMIDIYTTVTMPLLGGTIVGLCLMAWTRVSVSAFVLGCSFLGSAEIAPVVSEWINRLLFAVTGDYGYLIDPIDLFFGLFKIELTDEWMLISMIIFMSLGIYTQIKRLEANNIPLNTPVIVYESTTEPNGRIHTANGYIDTK